jgi:tetratricopeptide (TPR) repeat protein
MKANTSMTFIERWQDRLPESLAAFAQLAVDTPGIDFTYGFLATGVLWPLRQPVKDYDGEAADAVHQLIGSQAGRILKLVNGWGDDPVAAARELALAASHNADLRAALTRLIDHFDSTQPFAEQLARHYAPQLDGTAANITGDIKAALVNIGGITNIDSLAVHLNLSTVTQVSPPLSKRWRYALGAAGLIVLIGALLGIYQFVLPRFIVARMDGALNIAVADFHPLTSGDCVVAPEDARGLAEQVYNALNDDLTRYGGQLGSIEVWPPWQTGAIGGATSQAQAMAAAQRANDVNADVIIYATLGCNTSPRETRLSPSMYISNRKLNASEHLDLIGHHPFGADVVGQGLPNSLTARRQLTSEMLVRLGALAQFFIGLDYFFNGNYEAASHAFEGANSSQGMTDAETRAVLNVFLGVTATRRDNLAQAQEHYKAALDLKPNYVRARYDLAESLYLASRGDCVSRGINASGLRDSLLNYQRVLSETVDPVDPDMRTWVAFGVGRVYWCMSQAQIDNQWPAAEHELKIVTEDYEHGNTRVRDVAAEAYNLLGLIYLRLDTNSVTVPSDRLCQAAAAYTKASKTSGYADRLATFYRMLGYIYTNLGQSDDALQAYDQADAYYINAIQRDPGSQAKYEASRQQLKQERAQVPPLASPAAAECPEETMLQIPT